MKWTIKITLVAAFLLASRGAGLCASQLAIWTWRNPVPTGNQLNSVAQGIINGKVLFVAVGTNGTIVTSANGGLTWDQQLVPSGISLSGVAFCPGVTNFVAVGADAASPPDNVILTSRDGINWTANSQVGGIGTGGLLAVACDSYGDFVAVGKLGVTLYSSGGGIWNTVSSGTTNNLNAVTYGNNYLFAVAGDNGTIFTSQSGGSNGVSATFNTSVSGESFNGIAYGNGTFVAVGDSSGFFYSNNGNSWTLSTSSYYGDSVVFANGEFVVANTITYSPSILTSSDGITWNAHDESPWLFASIAYGNGIFVGVGGTAGIAINFLNITAADDWDSEVTNFIGTALNAITYGENMFVAGGGGYGGPGVLTSPDGYNWQSDTDSSLFRFYNSFITGMAFGTPISLFSGLPHLIPEFVATLNTAAGYTPGIRGEIISSSDAIQWRLQPDSTNANVLNGIAYGGQAFVAVGNGGTAVSSINLSNWTSGTGLPAAVSFNGVAYGKSPTLSNPNGTPTFVAVGESGLGWFGQVIYYSNDDGLTWTPANYGPPFAEQFYGVTFGNGQFVAVGVDNTEPTPVGVIYTSSDGGVNWNQLLQTSYTFMPFESDPPPYNGVTFANGLFVAVTSSDVVNNNEYAEDGNGGQIFVSADGVHWIQSYVATPYSLNAVAAGGYQFIAVGSAGAILGSLLPAASGGSYDNGSGCFSFEVSGPPGTFGVYQSSDLSVPLNSWNFVQNVTFTSTMHSVLVQDCNPGTNPRGYYYLGQSH